jgi:hypothetical protein
MVHLEGWCPIKPQQYKEILMENIDKLFEFHLLNEEGKQKAKVIACKFHELLCSLGGISPESVATREFSLCKTKLEEACFFAKKAMATQIVNQQPRDVEVAR